MELNITYNKQAERFETNIEGHTAFVKCHQSEGKLAVLSTSVPKELEGRGIAAVLTKHVLEYAKSNKLRVQPVCSYTIAYIAKHPEYQELTEGI